LYEIILIHIVKVSVGKIALFGKLWFEGWLVWLANVCNVRWQNKKYGSAKNKTFSVWLV